MDIQIEIAIAAVLWLVGVRQIILGRRVRRVGSEPHCRKCEYDLRGLPEAVTNCSECGADLTLKNAKVRGVAIRRAAPIWKGLILLLIASVPTVHMVQRITANGWLQVEPVWMLRFALGSGDAQTRKAADMELWRRLSDDELSQTDLVRIAKWGANSTLSASELPKIVADAAAVARGAGRLSDEDFVKLWKTGFSPTVRMKEKVRQGNDLYFHVTLPNQFSGHAVASRVEFTCRNVTIDGHSVGNPREESFDAAIAHAAVSNWLSLGSFDVYSPSLRGIPAADVQRTTLGKHFLRFSVEYRLSVGRPLSAIGNYAGQVVVEREFELVGPKQPTVRLLKGPVQAQRALNGPMVTIWPNGSFLSVWQPSTSDAPIPMAFRVFLKDANHRFEIGSWTRSISERITIDPGFTLEDRPAELVGDKFDVIFEPDPELAEKGQFVNEMWGERIEFKDFNATPK